MAEYRRLERAYQLCVIDDHDPQTLPHALAVTLSPPPSGGHIRSLLRSWEAIERITTPASPKSASQAVNERVTPFLMETGLSKLSRSLASDHFFLMEEGLLIPWLHHPDQGQSSIALAEPYRRLIEAARELG